MTLFTKQYQPANSSTTNSPITNSSEFETQTRPILELVKAMLNSQDLKESGVIFTTCQYTYAFDNTNNLPRHRKEGEELNTWLNQNGITSKDTDWREDSGPDSDGFINFYLEIECTKRELITKLNTVFPELNHPVPEEKKRSACTVS